MVFQKFSKSKELTNTSRLFIFGLLSNVQEFFIFVIFNFHFICFISSKQQVYKIE